MSVDDVGPDDASPAEPSPADPPADAAGPLQDPGPDLRKRLRSEPRTVAPMPGDTPDPLADAEDRTGRRALPPVDPTAPLDPALRMTPEELAARDAVPPPPPSRRFVLGTAALVLLGAGGGVGWSFWRTRHHLRRTAPQGLVDAARAERDLVAAVEAELAAHPEQGALLRQLRADHAAHAATLDAAVAAHTGRSPSATAARPGSSPPPARPVSLLTAERTAATVAARRAEQLTGRDAVLLASIAACEATHAALLT